MVLINKLIVKISSLKFAIFLMLFIAISSGLGTLIPQGNEEKVYIDFYNSEPFLGFLDGNKILFLELDHIYTSTWFLISLVLLCFSLSACSFKRQIPSLKASLKWIDYDNIKKFKRLKIAYDWEIINEKELIFNSNKLLNERGWKSKISENRISARKGIIGKLGPIIVHIGLIILLIGSAYGNFTNQTKEQYLKSNEEIDLINDSSNQKYTIKLKDFVIEREFDGKPKQFISTLYFKSNETNAIELKETKVNHPIRFKGLTIYQADWSISNIVLRIDGNNYQFTLKPIPEIGEQIWGIVIELGKELKKNYLITIDNENGPVKIFNSETFKETDLYLNDKEETIYSSKIQLLKIIPSSGLIIKSDPSIPFIYSSFIFIIIGTILSLIPTKQLWILIHKEKAKLYIGGLSNRNLSGFKTEFEKISEQIKQY
tara:strand:+ start:2768 stop:4054 length:1287 start_codon:yes stop_codon:yes gene_type:complete